MRRLVIASLACVALAALLSAVKPCYQERNMILLLPPSLTMVAWMVTSRRWCVAYFGIALAVLMVAAAANVYRYGHVSGDYRAAVEGARRYTEGATMVYTPNYARLPWEHYAGRSENAVEVPRHTGIIDQKLSGRVVMVSHFPQLAINADRQILAMGYTRIATRQGIPIVVVYEKQGD